jgi:hypothetical protein
VNHDQAELLLSSRIDGERLTARQSAALERHLQGCERCRAFERGAYRLRESTRFQVAPAVPDLVEPIMSAVRGTRPALPRVVRLPARRRPRRLVPRLAPLVAALTVGAIAGSLVVGGPWGERAGEPALAASDVVGGVNAAAVRLHAYEATFAIVESNLSAEVPTRELTMHVWFGAPERFRLDVTDHTAYPVPTTPTDLRLIVDGPSWYAAGPAPCPAATCPLREAVVRNRLPFSTAAPIPTDLVLPLDVLADTDDVTVLGRGTVLGRSAVRVEVPFERARPLFPFLELGGEWRPFFERDRVRIWLDERSWFPLRWEVLPAPGAERRAWALRFGLPQEPPGEQVFSAVALDVSLEPPAAGIFAIPAAARGRDQGARPVALADLGAEAGFEPIAPPQVAGLELYRAALPPEGPVLAYADGLAFLTLGQTTTWDVDAPFGPVGALAEEVTLPGGGVAYYEPASAGAPRRLSIHAEGTDLFLESNLSRADLLAAAASLPVRGLPLPESWRVRTQAGARIERVTLPQARAALPFPVELPATLPEGYALASVELVDAGYGLGVTLYFRHRDAEGPLGTIRLHLEPGTALPPATSARQAGVDVGGSPGRFTPARSQLEWVQGGLYRSLDAPGLDLAGLVAIAASIGDAGA